MRIGLIALLLALLASLTPAQTRPATTQPSFGPEERQHVLDLGSRRVRVHDPSTIVKCGDEFWVFCTGPGLRSYHSRDLGDWEPGPTVFHTPPDWAPQVVPGSRGIYYWAPDIVHVGDRYLMYYSVSIFGKNTSAIGLVATPTLDPTDPKYQWTDQGPVIHSERADNYNTIDPSVMLDRDGKLWLSFGSYWSGIKLIELDPKTGKRIATDSPMSSLAHAHDIEASCIYRHGDDYFLFVNWGLCCRGVNSTYNIRVGRSKTITGPYLDKDGKDLLAGGGTLLVGSEGAFIGPGHAGVVAKDGKTYLSMHFYDGTRFGMSQLAIRELTWDERGWPAVIPR